MKKFLSVILSVCIMASMCAVPVYAADSGFDKDTSIGAATGAIAGVVSAAAKAVEEAVKSVKNAITVEIVNMSNSNGKTMNMTTIKFTDAKPIIVEGRTLIPIRAVAEAIGYKVEWLGDTAEIVLTSRVSMKGNEYDEFRGYPARYNQAQSIYSCFKDLEAGKGLSKTAPGFTKVGKKVNCAKFTEFVTGHGGHFENVIKMGVNNVNATSTVRSDFKPLQNLNSLWGFGERNYDLYKKYDNTGYMVAHYKMDVAPLVVNGRTYIPLRAATELMGMDVKWDNETRTVTITAESAK